MNTQMVIARYNEDISWLDNYENVIIYNKGEDVSTKHKVVSLPNIGREAHTIFHHIVSNYDDLADITVFLPGNPFDHIENLYHLSDPLMVDFFIKKHLFSIPDDFYMSDNYLPFHLAHTFDGMLDIDKNNLPMDYQMSESVSVKMKLIWHDWWKIFIDPNGLIDYNKWTRIYWHSMFSVKKEAILSNKKSYYEFCLQSFDGIYPIEVNYFESAWSYVFNVIHDKKMYPLR